MRPNPLAQRLLDGLPCRGMWLTLPCVPAVRLVAQLDFDWFCIDAEHGPIGIETLAGMVAALADAGAAVLVRVAASAREPIQRALDAGAAGIIAPMVGSQNEAAALVSLAKYPPVGQRSLGSPWAGLAFELDLLAYAKHANAQTLCFAQIESVHGVYTVSEIAATIGIDGLFVGPVDLGLSQRIANPHPESDNPVLTDALDKILHAAQSADIPVGIYSSSPQAAAGRIAQGFALVTVANDAQLLMTGAKQSLWSPP